MALTPGESRYLTTSRGAALYIGAILGPGLLLLPGLAAAEAGPASILAWLALLAIPAIVACYLVSGSSDFLVEAAVPDLAAYEQLLLGRILTIPSVVEAQSTFAIRTILSRGPLPLDHWR